MTETVMQFKSVDDIIRFSRAAEQCTSHTYIMQGKTKIRADDLLAIFCVDYTFVLLFFDVVFRICCNFGITMLTYACPIT